MYKIFVDSNVIDYAVLDLEESSTLYNASRFSKGLFKAFEEKRHEGFYSVDIMSDVGLVSDIKKRDKMLRLMECIKKLDYSLMVDKITDYLIVNVPITDNHRHDASSIAYSIYYGLDILATFNHVDFYNKGITLNRKFSKIVVEDEEFEVKLDIVKPTELTGLVFLKEDEWWIRAKYRTSKRLNIEAYKRGVLSKDKLDEVVNEIDLILSKAEFI